MLVLLLSFNVNEGVKESDTGLAPPNLWDIPADRQRMSEEHSLQVARCTKIIPKDPVLVAAAEAVNPPGGVQGQKGADEQDKYVINIKQIAKFVVGLADRVAPTDIEEGMRVGYVVCFTMILDAFSNGHVRVDRNKYQIQIPLPPKIDPSVTMMQVEEKPDVTYSDVGGCKEQIEKLREVVETPLISVWFPIMSILRGVLIIEISRNASLISVLTRPKVFFCLDHQELGKHCVREL